MNNREHKQRTENVGAKERTNRRNRVRRSKRENKQSNETRAVPFIPMPMPKPVCRTHLYNKIVQLEVCRTFSGGGMGINGTAHKQSNETIEQ